jgi:hypothetical protein
MLLYVYLLYLPVLIAIMLIFKPYVLLPPVDNEDFEKELNKELEEMENEKRNKKLQVLRRRLKQKS